MATWSERQLAMLREMGIRLWPAGEAPGGTGDASVARHAEVEAASAEQRAGQAHQTHQAVQAHRSLQEPDLALLEADESEAAASKRSTALIEPATPTTPAIPATPAIPTTTATTATPAPAASVAQLAEAVANAVAARSPAINRARPGAAQPSGDMSPSQLLRETASMTFDELATAASTCTACRRCEGRRNVVFGAGPARADWMIVGDAPDASEDESGQAFVGHCGLLLDNMLRACGVSRDASSGQPEKQAFVTNSVKCRPRSGSNPTGTELASCEPWLLGQIRLVKPKVIVAMGPNAVRSLLHSTEPLGKLRGRVHRMQTAPDVSVVVTYKIDYLLRQPEEKARAWDDLCLAMEVAAGASPAG